MVSHLDFVPGSLGDGLISDVWALGDFAYLGSFDEPFCSFDLTGVRIADISNPAQPELAAFIKAPVNTRNNDVKAAHLETRDFTGDILVATNEPCFAGFIPRLTSFGVPPAPAKTGVSIYNVTNPRQPHAMRLNFLDFPVHNTFIYQQGDRAYMVVVDDVNLRDVHIVDITKPQAPVEIAVTGEPDWPPGLDNIGFGEFFLHDVWVQQNEGKVIAYLSYWDIGLVLLDLTDPANPVFLGDSDFIIPDPLSGEFPEGNLHVAAPTEDGRLVITGDEDFAPGSLTVFEIEGASVPAFEGAFTTPVFSLPGAEFDGTIVRTNSLACGPIPDAPAVSNPTALISRGVCRFDLKATNAINAGYVAMVVHNDEARGNALVTMSGDSRDIVGFFVGFDDGEAMDTGDLLHAEGLFDGWGYMRVMDVTDPRDIKEIGEFATERVFLNPPPSPDEADLLTAHNVIVRDGKAYWSWYYEGMRVVDFSSCVGRRGPRKSCKPTEVAHFELPDNGSNFWGVYLHDHPDGNTYILGSDRENGLWIFETP